MGQLAQAAGQDKNATERSEPQAECLNIGLLQELCIGVLDCLIHFLHLLECLSEQCPG
jgi:hypothetical protein